MKKVESSNNIVVTPVKILESGEVSMANPIFTDHQTDKEALKQAKEASSLSRYPAWNFLISGRVQHGKVVKDKDFDKQIRNIKRNTFQNV